MDFFSIASLLRFRGEAGFLLIGGESPPDILAAAPEFFKGWIALDRVLRGGALDQAVAEGQTPVMLDSRWRLSDEILETLSGLGFARCITREESGWRELELGAAFLRDWCRRRSAATVERRRFLDTVCRPIDPAAIQKEHGAAWYFHLPDLADTADDAENMARSALVLFEDGMPLGPAHSDHTLIREAGNGRYSHWVEHVYFSIPNGGDPTANGRRYEFAVMEQSQLDRLKPAGADPDDGEAESLDDCLERLAPAPESAHPRRIVLMIGSLGAGGAERQLCNLAVGLKSQGWDVHVLTLFALDGPSAHFVGALAENGHISVASIAEGPGWSFADLDAIAPIVPRLPEEIREITLNCYAAVKRLDPAMVVCYLDLVNVVGGIAATLTGVPSVLICARSVAPHHFPHIFKPWLAEYYRALEKRRTIRFGANSNAGARSYEAWLGLDDNSIQVVRNGMAPGSLPTPSDAERQAFRDSLDIPEDAPLVAGILRFTFEKRPLFFLEVMHRLRELVPDVRAVIAGDGPMWDEVADRRATLGLEDRVYFLNRRDDVPVILSASDLLLHISSNEGFPNALMEAQWLSRPVVCTRVGGMLEALSDVLTPFSREIDDVDGLARACAQLLRDKTEARRIGSRARAECEYRFSASLMVRETLEILEGNRDCTVEPVDAAGLFTPAHASLSLRYFLNRAWGAFDGTTRRSVVVRAKRTKELAPILPKQPDRDVLDMLACPSCARALNWDPDGCVCANGHRFPVRLGVARFAPDTAAGNPPPTREELQSLFLDGGGNRGLEQEPAAEFLRTVLGIGQADVAGRYILDVSAGAGRIAAVLADWGATVVAMERGGCVDWAHRFLLDRRRAIVVQCGEDLPLAGASFDLVLCTDGLRSWPRPAAVLEKLPGLLTPDGEILLLAEDERETALPAYRDLANSARDTVWRGWCAGLLAWLKRKPGRFRRTVSGLPADLIIGREDSVIRFLEAAKSGTHVLGAVEAEEIFRRTGCATEIDVREG